MDNFKNLRAHMEYEINQNKIFFIISQKKRKNPLKIISN